MKKEEKLPLILIWGMPVIAIIASMLSNVHINMINSSINASVFFYPLIILLLGLIMKKTNYKRAINLLAVTLIVESLVFVLKWALLDIMDYYLMIYLFTSILFCGLIFIFAFEFLRNFKIDSYVPVFILVLIITLLDNAIFALLVEGEFINLSILVRLGYSVVIPVFLAKNTAGNTTKKVTKK